MTCRCRLTPRRRRPCRLRIGRCASDGQRLADWNGGTRGRSRDGRRGRRGVAARTCGRQSGLQGGWLRTHVGEEIHRRLADSVVGGRRLSLLNGCCLDPKPTAPCRHQRPRRRSEPGTSSGGELPCPARTCCRSPGGSRPRFLFVVDRRIRPAGWKPLSGDSSHS